MACGGWCLTVMPQENAFHNLLFLLEKRRKRGTGTQTKQTRTEEEIERGGSANEWHQASAVGEVCAVQSPDRAVGRVTGRYRSKKWSADVVGCVFNARADTGRHTSTQQNTRSAQRCTQPSCRKPFLCVYTYSWFIKLLIYSTNVFWVQVNWFWKLTDWIWTFFHCGTSYWICSWSSYNWLNTQINIQVKTFLQSLMSTGVTLINVQTLIFFLNFLGNLNSLSPPVSLPP